MFPHSNRETLDGERVPVDGLVRTHWALAICAACGHEQPHGENHRATCPGCGAQLHAFALYRELRIPAELGLAKDAGSSARPAAT
jgi:hypothetical protein